MEHKHNRSERDKNYIELIEELIGSVQYGTISISIQDGKVVQVEKNEKYRLK